MKISLLVVCVSILFSFSISSQSIIWERNYGGSKSDVLNSICKTSDGGFLMLGRTNSQNGGIITSYYGGTNDFLAVKVNSNGNVQWVQNYGGSIDDIGYSVVETPDGGFLLAGESSSSDVDISNPLGNYDGWIIKIDMNGTILWEKSYGGSASDGIYLIKKTLDGNYICSGFSTSLDGHIQGIGDDEFLLKIDPSGNVIWVKTYPFIYSEEVLLPTNDGGYIFEDLFDSDAKIFKTDGLGNVQWTASYGGSQSDAVNSIIQTNDGGYALFGFTFSSNGDVSSNNGLADYWLVKIDANGVLQWEKNYGGTNWDFGFEIAQLSNGGYILSGDTYSQNVDVSGHYGSTDIWVLEVDNVGNIVCDHNYGTRISDNFSDLIVLNNTEIILGGSVREATEDVSNNYGGTDYWLAKVNLCSIPCPVNYAGANALQGNASNTGGNYDDGDYETDGVLESTQTIPSGTTIDYDSQTAVCLNNGFTADANSLFTAFIDGCNNGAGGSNAKSGKEAKQE